MIGGKIGEIRALEAAPDWAKPVLTAAFSS
jgi:hypothetical protein